MRLINGDISTRPASLNNTEDYADGWCPKGERLTAERRSHRPERVSFMAAWHQHRLVAPLTYDAYCNRVVFETWLETQLSPGPPYGSVIICDNVAFHKGGCIEALIQLFCAYFVHLPPDSPDLSPIEHQWFALEHRMRQQIQTGQPLRPVVDQALID